MTKPRKRTTAIVPRAFFTTGLATAVPACALAMAQACGGTTLDDTYAGAAADAHLDHIFVADVTAHFACETGNCNPVKPLDSGDEASDADADTDANADASEDGG